MEKKFYLFEPIFDHIPFPAIPLYEFYGYDSPVLLHCKASRKKIKRNYKR